FRPPRAGNCGCGRPPRRHRDRADQARPLFANVNKVFWIVQLIGAIGRTHIRLITRRHPPPFGRAIMEQRKLGSTGPAVSALGLGCMGMSEVYGPADRGEAIATVHAALDAGITLIDTGDFYAMGHNEMLLREALKDVARDKFQISVKYGALRGPAGDFV